jgi:hypothetical protein
VPEILIDDHSFQVLKSFRPFLGDRGNGFVTTLESLQELLTSEPAQKTLQSFRLFGIGEKFKTMEMVGEAAANPFNLFLILILLLLADLPLGGGSRASAYGEELVFPVQLV